MHKKMALVPVFLMVLSAAGYARAVPRSVKPDKTPPGDSPVAQAAASPQKFTPIEIRRTGTAKKPSETYYHDGVKLDSYRQLKAVISPLKDAQADRLLAGYANRDSTGTVFVVIGGLAGVSGVVYSLLAGPATQISYFPTGLYGTMTAVPQVANADMTPTYVLEAIGGVCLLTGVILKEDAGDNRRDAVKRYNQVVGEDRSLSMILSPDWGPPGLECTAKF